MALKAVVLLGQGPGGFFVHGSVSP